VKPVESTIFAGVSEIPQHGQIACPDRSKCDFLASWMLFKTSMSTLRKRLKNVFLNLLESPERPFYGQR
jgi:hypothetical protein